MPRIRLLPECHADTTLVAFLVGKQDLHRHTLGSEVVGDMKAAAKDFEVVAGIVDTDATTPRYFDLFKLLNEENKIRFLHRPESGEYLIMNTFRGAEDFILWNAQQVGIDLADYGFANTVKGLIPRLKKLTIETDPDYLRLLTDLHARQAPGILTLERLLNDLITT
jgi:hypothetical protein